MTTAAQRSAARDFWNSPRTIAAAHVLDWAAVTTFTIAIVAIGSLNF